jgi:predicted DNA-binding protein
VRPTKGKQVAIRLEPELEQKLQAQADADQRPLAAMIRKILRDHTRALAQAQVAA